MSDAEAIKNYKIVAMTTTGCAKYSTILEQNNFETIIIEEAAEVLESHVLSLLTKNTKQLILIGDHKQLKPKPYNFELETKYNFSVSMFERLINNKIPYAPLKYQRRMKPKFADFVRIIYGDKEYVDYKDVYNKEDVKGMESDMYFITHNKLEGENEALRSKQNDYEAKYLTKLCSYLIKQGYTVEEIAERSGLTVEQISSIENDVNLPSLGPLIKIARALGVRLGTFMDDNDALGPIVTRAADREKDSSISFSNDATDARKHMEYHPLAQQKAGRHMEPFVIDINPEESPEFQLSAHEGEEFIYVMQGEIEIVYGKETYNLKEGDSIFYDSIVKHHVHGAPGKSAKILAVVYIPF